MTMKSTNFKTKVGSTLLMLVCCCLMMHNAGAQSPASTFPHETQFKISGTLGDGVENQTFTFVVPQYVYKIQIQCWGAGAAGAYMDAPGGTPVSGAGGGGGAYARVEYDVTPGQSLTVVVGHGGSGKENTRGKGGNSYVKLGNDTIVLAAGAPAVADNQRTPGGLGGSYAACKGVAGYVAFSGGNGGTGNRDEWTCSGAGGGAAGISANGSNGGNGMASDLWETRRSIGGAAGPGNPADGKGAAGVVSHIGGTNGNSGANYGGGGSGGASSALGSANGGNGGNGIVIISYDDCAPATAGVIEMQNDGCTQRLVNVTSGTGTAFVYSWEKSDNGTDGWTRIAGATAANYTPTTSGYYRRGVTACDATVYSQPKFVEVEGLAISVGTVSMSGNPATETWQLCKKNDLSIALQANNCSPSVQTIYWEYSLDNGNSWTQCGSGNRTDAKQIIINSLNSNCVIRYYHQATESCKIYPNNDFNVSVYPGALSQTNDPFTFDNSAVNIVLPYGVTDTVPYIQEPSHNYNTEVAVTNNMGSTNEGNLLGRILVGTYPITWTVTDCSGDTRDYTQNIIVSYPDCGGNFKAVDAEGAEYETVRIGVECWMKTNLKSGTYSDEKAIEQCGDDAQIEGVAPYNNEESNVATYGKLYSWFAAMGLPEDAGYSPTFNEDGQLVGACPKGWHLPTLEQCQELSTLDDLAPKGGYYDGSTSTFGGLGTILAIWCIDSEKPAGHSNFIINTVEDCDTPLGPVSTNPNSKMSIRCIHDAQ